jgi:hypothetical protein
MTDQRQWTIELDVEGGKCREMATALRASTPAYTTDVVLTAVPTYTVALNHWGFSGADVLRELGLDIRRVLHASEEFEYPNGPLKQDQRLTGQMRVTDTDVTIRPDGSVSTKITLRTEFREHASDVVVLVVTRTILERKPAAAS